MKKFILLMAFICSINLVSAQSIKGISVGSMFSPSTGLQLDAGMNMSLHSKIDMNIGYTSNFRYSKGFRTNLNYKYFSKGKFSSSIGIGYAFKHNDISEFNRTSYNRHDLEIPLSFQYQLSDKIEIDGSIINSIKLNETRHNKFENSIRLGLNYRW